MITNPTNGNQLRFPIGLADPERIKSANYNYVWIEEATELNVTKGGDSLDTRMRQYNSNGPQSNVHIIQSLFHIITGLCKPLL